MTEQTGNKRRAILICTCSGACPSMSKIDFWALTERLRLEMGDRIEFVALHPRLCEEDGERFMGRILKDDLCFITPACLPKRQEKLLKAGFDKAGVPMDSAHWIPIGMGMLDTESVFQSIVKELTSAGGAS